MREWHGVTQTVVILADGVEWPGQRYRSLSVVAREIFATETVASVFTDPPYNVPVDGHVSGLGATRHREFAFAASEMSREAFTAFLKVTLGHAAASCRDGAIAFVCMDWRHMGELIAAGEAVFTELDRPVRGRGAHRVGRSRRQEPRKRTPSIQAHFDSDGSHPEASYHSGRASQMKPLNCAIYTRKSSDEGLEKEFNSLDAQREACTAYVVSQKHAGWTALSDLYDDGGLSGGTMERPALQRLLTDIRSARCRSWSSTRSTA